MADRISPFKGRLVSYSGRLGYLQGPEFQRWVDGQVSRLDPRTRKAHTGKSVPRDKFPYELTYRSTESDFRTSFPLRGPAGTAAYDEPSFIYLDVGAWIGSQYGNWRTHTGYQRDFGIICGPHVLLCTFSYCLDAPKHDDADWLEVQRAYQGNDKAVGSILVLLSALAALGDKMDAGTPKVARYLRANATTLMPAENDLRLHVILGDMHIPVVEAHENERPKDDAPLDDAHGGGVIIPELPWLDLYNKLVEKVAAQGDGLIPEEFAKDPDFVELKKSLDDTIDDKIDDAVGWLRYVGAGHVARYGVHWAEDKVIDVDRRPLRIKKGPRVLRHGRLDIGPIEDLLANVGIQSDSADGLLKLLPTLQHLIDVGKTDPSKLVDTNIDEVIGMVIGDVRNWRNVQDLFGIQTNTMTVEDARAWLKYTSRGTPEAPQADIFEGAAEDLVNFVEGIEAYHEEMKTNPEVLPLQFHQLGDMIDLWMGFSCYFLPGGNVGTTNGTKTYPDTNFHKVTPSAAGAKMVDHWTKNCFERTGQGKRVADALTRLETLAGKDKNRRPHLLYGNHDNYLASISAPHGGLRKPFFQEQGMYMLHGHQWDSSNADNTPLLPLTRMILGTNSPLGEVVTQAAFIAPGPIRAFEEKATSFANNLEQPAAASGAILTERLSQVCYAAQKALDDGTGFYVYGMGHTHVPCLCRIILKPDDIAPALDAIRNSPPEKRPTLTPKFTAGGDVTHGATGPLDVRLDWARMYGGFHHDWVALEDPLWPRGERRNGLWKWVSHGSGEKGHVTFERVPPGLYVARAYLDAHETDPVADTSKQPPIRVFGLSMSPWFGDYTDDHSHTDPPAYKADVKKGISPPPIARFAFPDMDTVDLEPYHLVMMRASFHHVEGKDLEETASHGVSLSLGQKAPERQWATSDARKGFIVLQPFASYMVQEAKEAAAGGKSAELVLALGRVGDGKPKSHDTAFHRIGTVTLKVTLQAKR